MSVDRILWVTRTTADGVAIALAAVLAGHPPPLVALFGVVGMAVVFPSRRVRGLIDPDPFAGLAKLAGRVVCGCVAVAALLSELDLASVGLFGVLTLVLVVVARMLHRVFLHAIRRRGRLLENALIVGAGPQGATLAGFMQRLPEFGVHPIGFVDVFDDPDSDLPVLGDVDAVPALMSEHDVSRVIVAFGGVAEHDLVQCFRRCVQLGLRFRANVLPRFFDLGVGIEGQTDDLWAVPLMPVDLPRRRELDRA